MAFTGALRILRHRGYALPYWTLRADSNEPCELAHIYLTALACSAQWTGVYGSCLDALVRSGRDHRITTGMLIAMCVRTHDLPLMTVCYAQILNPV